jgi:hypothetical protein
MATTAERQDERGPIPAFNEEGNLMTTPEPVTLPFGKHRGEPLGNVPASYLVWLTQECKLGSGLFNAVAGELASRGLTPPAQPPPRPVFPCRRCPGAGYRCSWFEDSLGRRRIKAECTRCHATVDHPPSVPPYSTEADASPNDRTESRPHTGRSA